ncbi:hypothetical protein OG689_05900 [Kitasatospora sp. NBC_00240]|uniref:hypothetical protein n=1 Tax=Kitasatospora sp. NBC_00240 TaxID=2903567 RepID=UPI0022594546|nr:hypothetical protein [Kitasatospora sp. NBC_00240]MCX5208829.1 hypothetical protein [Kitasatospora sp. NBC_00240]
MGVVILLVLLGAGAGLILTGVGKLQTEVPTCYGRPMAPGDTCVAHSTGPVTDGMPTPQDATYQEQLDSLTSGGWTSIGLGLVLLALCVVIGLTWATGAGRDRPR